MGEIADMALDGTLCEQCGELMLEEGEVPPGHPQTCKDCLVVCGEYAFDDVATCTSHGVHLTDCDDDGYCTFCGEQEEEGQDNNTV